MSAGRNPSDRDLYRAAEWVSENRLTLSTIGKVAEEAMFHTHVVERAAKDPNGRRVAALRDRVARLREVVDELGDFPEPTP
jgi:hypothetical protein